MTTQEIRAICVKAMVDVTGLNPVKFTDGAKFDDLGIDNFDIVEATMAVEIEIESPINEDDIKTFGDFVKVACEAVAKYCRHRRGPPATRLTSEDGEGEG